MTRGLSALLFDKDGTLFDFAATWNGWAERIIAQLSEGDPSRRAALAEAARYDLERGAFHPESPVIAGTNREAAETLAGALPDCPVDSLEDRLAREAAAAPVREAVPLRPLLSELAKAGLTLGVMTNDTETSARAHLRAAGVEDAFAFIAGFDSGFGAKPDPGPLLAFAERVSVPPGRVAMIGDSTHDLLAAQRAGMRAVGVLTGPAGAETLAPLAEAVLPDIGHLPAWLGLRGAS